MSDVASIASSAQPWPRSEISGATTQRVGYGLRCGYSSHPARTHFVIGDAASRRNTIPTVQRVNPETVKEKIRSNQPLDETERITALYSAERTPRFRKYQGPISTPYAVDGSPAGAPRRACCRILAPPPEGKNSTHRPLVKYVDASDKDHLLPLISRLEVRPDKVEKPENRGHPQWHDPQMTMKREAPHWHHTVEGPMPKPKKILVPYPEDRIYPIEVNTVEQRVTGCNVRKHQDDADHIYEVLTVAKPTPSEYAASSARVLETSHLPTPYGTELTYDQHVGSTALRPSRSSCYASARNCVPFAPSGRIARAPGLMARPATPHMLGWDMD